MALIPDFDTKLKDGCKTFHITDKFNWGAPEVEVGVATAASIDHESSLGVTTTVNVYPTLPNDADLEYDLTTLIGSTGTIVIPNQFFYLTYNVFTTEGESSFVYNKKKLIFIDCEAADCVAKKLAAIEVCDCDCDPGKVDNAILANTLLKAARQAACCNQTKRWTELIAMVVKLCKTC